jgi:porphobilinogen synthase
MFPRTRMRRLRLTEGLRRLAREVELSMNDLILPLFVVSGRKRREPIHSLPGVERVSVDMLAREVESLLVPAVLLFGVPDDNEKDVEGTAAWAEEGLIPQAVKAIKGVRPDLVTITDVCACAYTSHGHCGLVNGSGRVMNDPSLVILARAAKAHAAAGVDLVAPSAMLDGQVHAIRTALDEADFPEVGIMSYAAKFASAFYGPFREAARSAPSFGDRASHQLPLANAREAVRDALQDEAEGADWLMVKPAIPYLDVIRRLRQASDLPIAAYQVSGEYAMLKLAGESGALSEREAVLESLTGMKRAGANAIITYYAREVSEWLRT